MAEKTPNLPAPVENATAGFFGALSAIRRKRIFHPTGVGYRGTFQVEWPGDEVPLFGSRRIYPAVIRFSRALGLPERLPDLLGLTARIENAHGSGRHQDFPLITSADGPVLHHLLLPAVRGFFGQSFSSILVYRMGGRLRLVGALPASPPPRPGRARGALAEIEEAACAGDLRFSLATSSLGGRWRPVGTLSAEERLPDEETERLRFNPWNTGGGIRPTGPFMGLRDAAYRGSQAARAA